MGNVVCWCCEYFLAEFGDIKNKERITNGQCELHNTKCMPHNDVCEDFLLMQGLFTERNIPRYCKNYNGDFNRNKKFPYNFYKLK